MVDAEERATDKRQWRETSYKPVAIKRITSAEIEETRRAFTASYKCPVECIGRRFESVRDNGDIDRNDCVVLIFSITEVSKGKGRTRDIWSTKIPIPEDILQRAQADLEKKREAARQEAREKAARAAAEKRASLAKNAQQ